MPRKRVPSGGKPEPTKGERLTHWNERGEARMVDVGAKPATARTATATARVRLGPGTAERIAAGTVPKGDVFAVARLAGIGAAKRTDELIPLCHGIALTGVDVELTLDRRGAAVDVRATARAFDRTGVEMEALVAATVASLTLYDMLKAIDRGVTITDVALVEKTGGRSGTWRRETGSDRA
jgi:cyclic pyranopterin phosphate synthase